APDVLKEVRGAGTDRTPAQPARK
ncbi:MAG: Peptidase, M23/M37 family, partial [Porphyrobacter sp. HL-46]